jgi:23S rRNA (adenine2503-C2)-methyltransferase
MNMKPSLYSHTAPEWEIILNDRGHQGALPYWLEGLRGRQDLWQKHLSPELLQWLRETYSFTLPEVSRVQESEDSTVKLLIKFPDGLEVETVLIPFHKRFTICLSTQVGCAMNCSFCYTGTQGLKRHLKASEIVGQYLLGFEWLKKNKRSSVLPHVVFMGQGEPLHNADEVHRAIRVLNDPLIVGVGLGQMTLSTVGYLPGLKKFQDFPKINFALSLHSPFSDERAKLIPAEKKFPISTIMEELRKMPLLRRQFITFEYILIRNLNMSEAHVEALSDILKDQKAIVNLIPFNPFPGTHWERPTETEIESFKDSLVAKKLRVMVRKTKGDDILAACGQLKILQEVTL